MSRWSISLAVKRVLAARASAHRGVSPLEGVSEANSLVFGQQRERRREKPDVEVHGDDVRCLLSLPFPSLHRSRIGSMNEGTVRMYPHILALNLKVLYYQ